jgi:hypothetical protein
MCKPPAWGGGPIQRWTGIMTQFPPWVDWAKVFSGPVATVVAAIIVTVVTIFFQWRQWIVGKEKLRHDLYDRRFAIYMAFHNLLVAIVEKQDIAAELREANAAQAQSPFLLDKQLGSFLEELGEEAFRINTNTKLYSDQSFAPTERAAQLADLATDRLRLCNRIDEMAKHFTRFLRLKDFS